MTDREVGDWSVARGVTPSTLLSAGPLLVAPFSCCLLRLIEPPELAELAELDRGLAASLTLLGEGSRLAVVSFHSLEDRRVKTFFQERSGSAPKPSRHIPIVGEAADKYFDVIERRGRIADDAEIRRNVRSRSARLRWGVRTSAPMRTAA